jgi:death-on-curing protein
MIFSIESSFFGARKYNSIEERAVAYFFFINKNHFFLDGNKRLSLLVFLLICRKNKLSLNKKPLNEVLEVWVVLFANLKEEDIDFKVLKSVFFDKF